MIESWRPSICSSSRWVGSVTGGLVLVLGYYYEGLGSCSPFARDMRTKTEENDIQE